MWRHNYATYQKGGFWCAIYSVLYIDEEGIIFPPPTRVEWNFFPQYNGVCPMRPSYFVSSRVLPTNYWQNCVIYTFKIQNNMGFNITTGEPPPPKKKKKTSAGSSNAQCSSYSSLRFFSSLIISHLWSKRPPPPPPIKILQKWTACIFFLKICINESVIILHVHCGQVQITIVPAIANVHWKNTEQYGFYMLTCTYIYLV